MEKGGGRDSDTELRHSRHRIWVTLTDLGPLSPPGFTKTTLFPRNNDHLGQGRAEEHAQQAGPNTRAVRQMTTVRPSWSVGTGRLGDAGTHRVHGCQGPVNLNSHVQR